MLPADIIVVWIKRKGSHSGREWQLIENTVDNRKQPLDRFRYVYSKILNRGIEYIKIVCAMSKLISSDFMIISELAKHYS